jgi:WD40 repeat protein
MALANIADLLYQLGLKVLVIDWDLEAPGIERYFPLDLDKALSHPGLINLLLKYKEKMTRDLPEGEYPFEDPEPYLIDVYPDTRSVGRLWLLTAGQRLGDADFAKYSQQVRDFDWKDFYDNWEAAIYSDWLRRHFEEIVDVVLIDSRTGVAETEGSSTYELADVVVLFCGASAQSLDGTAKVARSLARPIVKELRGGRSLPMLVVPSRIEDRAEAELLNALRQKFIETFESYLPPELGDDPALLWKLKIPYVPFYAFTEMLAVREYSAKRSEELVDAYANLLLAMAHLAPPDKTAYKALSHAMELLPRIVQDERPLLVGTGEAASLEPAITQDGPGVGGNGATRALSPLLPLDITASIPTVKLPPPYPGIVPYRAEDGHFYGRTAETRQMVQQLRNSRFLLLVGPSSSGKSSLLAAGLKPAILSSGYWATGFWAVLEMRPGSEPVGRLIELLGRPLDDPAQAVAAWLEAHRPAQRLLLMLDQLEELFLQADSVEQAKFIAIISELCQSEKCAVVAALRSDMAPDLQASGLWPSGKDECMQIAPIEGDNLREAIRQPALDVGVTIEPALVERLTADASNEPGRMPLLQEMMRLLWGSMERRTIRLSAYEHPGESGVPGLAVAIARQADQVWAGLAPEQQHIAKRIFIRLVQFGFGRPDTRRQQPVIALQVAGDDPQVLESTLGALVNSRLLVLDIQAGPNGDKTVDLAHEDLIQGWPKLQQWVNDLREAERTRRRLETRANEWERLGRSEGGLLDLAERYEAEKWLDSSTAKELGYSSLLLDLVQASKAAQEAAQQRELEHVRYLARRRKQVASLLGTLAILAGVLAVIAFWQSIRATQNERLSHALALSEQSLGALSLDPELSLLLAIEAVSTTQGPDKKVIPEAESALHQALLNSHVRQTFVDKAHPDTTITGVAYSPIGCKEAQSNQCYIVTTDRKGIIRVWSALDGRLIKSWQYTGKSGLGCKAPNEAKPDPNRINNVAFSADGNRMVTAGDDCTAEIWDTSEVSAPGIPIPEPVASLQGHTTQVWNAALNRDGSRAVTSSGDGTARVWDLGAGTIGPVVHATLTLPSSRYGVADATFSPDGLYVVTANAEHTVVLWDANSGAMLWDFEGHSETVWSVSFDATGTLLVTCGDDGKVIIWRVFTREILHTLDVSGNGLNRAAFSPDGQYVFAVGDDKKATVWNVKDGKKVVTLIGHRLSVHAAAFSPDGRLITTASSDGTVRIWDWRASAGEELPALNVNPNPPRRINDVSFSPDDKRIVTANVNGMVTIWELVQGSSGITASVSLVRSLFASSSSITTAVYSPDGKSILSASADKTVKVWDPELGTFSSPIEAHLNKVLSARYSADGKRIVTVTEIGDNPGSVIVWDPDPNNRDHYNLTYLGITGEHITCATFDPSGNYMATCSDSGPDGYLRIWDVSSNAAVTNTDRIVPLNQIESHYGPVLAADWSANGGIVTAGQDWLAKIWKGSLPFKQLEQQGTLGRHLGAVSSAVFNTRGDQVVTGSTDGTARVWDVGNFASRALLGGHTGQVRAVAFSPDGKIVATAGEDGTVRLYLNDIDRLMALAKSRVTRTFTPEEVFTYQVTALPSPAP